MPSRVWAGELGTSSQQRLPIVTQRLDPEIHNEKANEIGERHQPAGDVGGLQFRNERTGSGPHVNVRPIDGSPVPVERRDLVPSHRIIDGVFVAVKFSIELARTGLKDHESLSCLDDQAVRGA